MMNLSLLLCALFVAVLTFSLGDFSSGFKFDCPSNFTVPEATNARRLHPANIKVVMALGDSMTAGFAMKTFPPFDVVEFRGSVFSIGGDEGVLTLPNLLKHYNPHLVGASHGLSFPLAKGKELNAAVSGAIVQDLDDQIDYLVKELKTNYADSVNYEKDWKMITVLIGANNICSYCNHNTKGNVTIYQERLLTSMMKLRSSIPRLYVNLVPILDVSLVYDLALTSTYCREVFKLAKSECSCLHESDESRAAMSKAHPLFVKAANVVAEKMNSLDDPEFYIALQSGVMADLNVPAIGASFVSNLDCFHPSGRANEDFARYLWNNLFNPAATKKHFVDLNKELLADAPLYCPTESDFLQ
eukprot:GCRY01002407.1.p1 GENE.GCRY01002407.1~~GCRY01002407.1.p1  ORF type:complete len:357 (-),score=50.06 GCRY01002407.1:238-1308(-)